MQTKKSLGERYFDLALRSDDDFRPRRLNPKRALALYKLAAKHGCAAAYNSIGFSYGHGKGVRANRKIAKKYYKLGALSGDAVAQFNMGMCSKDERKYKKAMHWFRKAEKNGFDDASIEIAFLYLNGYGVKENIPRARKILRSCLKNDCFEEATYYLAESYLAPTEYQNIKIGLKYLRRAEELGFFED